MRILLIEDDPEMVEIVSLCFEIRWPDAKVLHAQLGEYGVAMARSENPDIVILDLGLPDMDGFDVCAQIRSSSEVPIVMLTVRDTLEEIMKGLELGADDYMTKPFKPVEFLARISTLLRRTHMPHLRDIGMVFQRDDVVIDFVRGRVYANREPVTLGPLEYRIFHYLVKNEGNVVPGQALLEYIWGREDGDRQDVLEAGFAKLRDTMYAYPMIRKLLEEEPTEGYSFARGTVAPSKLQRAKRS
ncbi:MAG: response regulator transcription factor [Chloroflexi bacterium]|nr:response regulator transcription factor [Chloroflexota bacterium]